MIILPVLICVVCVWEQAFHDSFIKRGVGALELLAVEMKARPQSTLLVYGLRCPFYFYICDSQILCVFLFPFVVVVQISSSFVSRSLSWKVGATAQLSIHPCVS